jgi:tRNA synthetases class I (M)
MTTYITVAIPYVNADPHIGYVFELIEADLAARARRALGEPVRFLGGTDEFSLKNVLAAEAEGNCSAGGVIRAVGDGSTTDRARSRMVWGCRRRSGLLSWRRSWRRRRW